MNGKRAMWILLAVSMCCWLPGAQNAAQGAEGADEAFAAFETAMREGQHDACQTMVYDLRANYPQDKRLAKALSDMGGVFIQQGRMADGRLLLLSLLEGGSFSELDREHTANGRIWYARAATRMGERDEARRVLMTLVNTDYPVGVFKALETLSNEELLAGMAIEDLEMWKLACEAIAVSGATEKMKAMSADWAAMLKKEISGSAQLALLRSFEDKYYRYKHARGAQAKADALAVAEAACQEMDGRLQEAEAKGILEDLQYLLKAKYYRGEFWYNQGSMRRAQTVWEQVLEYKDDPRLTDKVIVAQCQYCALLCKKGGLPAEEFHQEVLALLENPALDDDLIIRGFHWLAELAEANGDLEAAYQYRSEVVLNTPTPRLATRRSQGPAGYGRQSSGIQGGHPEPPAVRWLGGAEEGRADCHRCPGEGANP